MSGIFEEIKRTKRIIDDERESLYILEETLKGNQQGTYGVQMNRDLVEYAIDRRRLMIRALELYEKSLESTVNTAVRLESREKSYFHNENPTE